MDYKNIDLLSFSSPLGQEEKYLLKMFKGNKTFKIYYKYNSFFSSYNKESLTDILDKFICKFIIIKIKNIEYRTTIISSFEISTSHFSISYSNKYLELVSQLSLSDFTNLKDSYIFNKPKTVNLYKKLKDINSLNLTTEEVRFILDSKNSYNRLYDFEKNILIPTIEDININTHLKVSYTKLKANKCNPKSKIISFEFEVSNKLEGEINQYIESVEKLFKEKGINYDRYKKRLKEFIVIKGIKYFSDNLEIVLNTKGDFIENLFSSLDKDWSKNLGEIKGKTLLEFSKEIRVCNSISSYIYKISQIIEEKFPEENFKDVPNFFIKNFSVLQKDKIIIFISNKNKKLYISKKNRLILIELYNS